MRRAALAGIGRHAACVKCGCKKYDHQPRKGSFEAFCMGKRNEPKGCDCKGGFRKA